MDGQPKPTNDNDMNWTLDYIVGPDYLRVMSIPLIRGRFFTSSDNEKAPLVGVVDEVFARKYFGDADPIGKRIVMSSITLRPEGSVVQIVGVVARRRGTKRRVVARPATGGRVQAPTRRTPRCSRSNNRSAHQMRPKPLP